MEESHQNSNSFPDLNNCPIEKSLSVENDTNKDLVKHKVKDKSTNTIGGDNEFILELRENKITEQQSRISDLEKKIANYERKAIIMKQIIEPHLEEGSDLYYDYKFKVEQGLDPNAPLAKDPTTWTIEQMLWSAYKNQD